MKKRSTLIPSIPELYEMTPNDFSRGCEILGNAFKDDPIWSEILKDAPEKLSLVFGAPLKYCLKYGKIYALNSDLDGLAGWLDSSKIDMNIW